MRPLLALLLTGSALALSGCTADATDGDPWFGRSCEGHSQVSYSYVPGILLPSDVPADRPAIAIDVAQGQTLTAAATWQADVGKAQVFFDGPSRQVVQTDRAWTSTTSNAPAGTYTLGLEGAPMAAGVSYTLVLTATGCADHEAPMATE